MTLIARETIIKNGLKGIHDDEGLKKLDGYIEYSADTDDPDKLIEMFEREYTNHQKYKIEIVEDNK